MEALLRYLSETDLSHEVAHHGFHAVNNHVLGYTMQEWGMTTGPAAAEGLAESFVAGLSSDEYPLMVAHVHYHLDGHATSSFELVLDLILDGLVRLAEDGEADGAQG